MQQEIFKLIYERYELEKEPLKAFNEVSEEIEGEILKFISWYTETSIEDIKEAYGIYKTIKKEN